MESMYIERIWRLEGAARVAVRFVAGMPRPLLSTLSKHKH